MPGLQKEVLLLKDKVLLPKDKWDWRDLWVARSVRRRENPSGLLARITKHR